MQGNYRRRTGGKSSVGTSFNQSQNESYQRRTFNRGNNSVLQNDVQSSNEFRTLLIQINIDRIVFGYVNFTFYKIINYL